MDKDAFEVLFRDVLLARLAPLGFRFHGASLTLRTDLDTVSLIRLGGRMASSGAISHILCFRHSFLRDMDEAVPAAVPKRVFDYPYKFLPSQVRAGARLRYAPMNTHFDHDSFGYTGQDEASAAAWAAALGQTIAEVFLPWVAALTPDVARTEIRKYGENAWCERLWIADYDAWLKARR